MKMIVVSEERWKQVTEATLVKLQLASGEQVPSDKKTLDFHTVNFHVVKMLQDLEKGSI